MYKWGVKSCYIAVGLLYILFILAILDSLIFDEIYRNFLRIPGFFSLAIFSQGVLVIIIRAILERIYPTKFD